METAAMQIRRRSSLLPALLLVVSVVGALELGSRLMNYVQEEFGTEAHQRLENWQRLHALAENAPIDRQLRLGHSFFNRVTVRISQLPNT